jgi:hypothetical protein
MIVEWAATLPHFVLTRDIALLAPRAPHDEANGFVATNSGVRQDPLVVHFHVSNLNGSHRHGLPHVSLFGIRKRAASWSSGHFASRPSHRERTPLQVP